MSERFDRPKRIIAVPCLAPGGLQAERSGHFGHCECFTIIQAQGDGITAVEVVGNAPHHEGGCLDPVRMLGSLGVTDIVVGGMGARPLALFNDLGIAVYADQALPTVGQAIDALLQDNVPAMSDMHVCGGGTCGH